MSYKMRNFIIATTISACMIGISSCQGGQIAQPVASNTPTITNTFTQTIEPSKTPELATATTLQSMSLGPTISQVENELENIFTFYPIGDIDGYQVIQSGSDSPFMSGYSMTLVGQDDILIRASFRISRSEDSDTANAWIRLFCGTVLPEEVLFDLMGNWAPAEFPVEPKIGKGGSVLDGFQFTTEVTEQDYILTIERAR